MAASERYKGVDDLIRAVAQLRPTIPDLHLAVAGDGDDLMRLETLAAEMNVTNSVHFLQGLSREKLAACYARADVFALPSTGEGFGIVFLEAMAFGTPIVAVAAGGSDGPGRKRNQRTAGAPARSQATGRTLLPVCFVMMFLRSTLGGRGVERVRSQYNFERFESQLDEILSHLETVRSAKP